MSLVKLSFREIRSRPARSLLTLFGIVIGVMAIVATSLASTSARLAQIAMVRAVTGNASLEIEAVGGASFDGNILEKVASVRGVSVASPILRRYSNMTLADDPKTNDGPARYRVQLLGVIPKLDKQVRGYVLVEGKDLAEGTGEESGVLVDVSFAKSTRLGVGSDVRFLTKTYLQSAKVVGLVRATNASAGLQSGLIVGELRTIQKWTKSVGKLDAIQLVLEKEAKSEAVLAAVRDILPDDLRVREPTMRSKFSGESTVATEQGFRLAAGFAFLIAAFVIYNTFQMNIGERRRQLGILRSMGATRNQILWMIIREALWLGIIGSILGCILGHLASIIFRNVFAQLLAISIPASPWSIWPYLIATACGILVSLVGAAFPAIRAAKFSPAEAMRVVTSSDFSTTRKKWLIWGIGTLTVALLIQFLSLSGWIGSGDAVIGALGMKIGIVLLLPAFLPEIVFIASYPLSLMFPVEVKLARRQILRHRGRSSLTIGTVFIAMGTGLGMASTILDNIRNVEGWYQKAIIGDFFVRAAMPDMNSGQSADMPDGLSEKVAEMPGVAIVDILRFVRARSNDNSVIVVVRNFNSPSQDYFDLVEGKDAEVLQSIREGQVVLGSVLSQRMNLHVGDQIPLETNDGSTTLRVAGVTNEYIAGGLTLYLEAGFAKKLLNVEGTDVIVVKANRSDRALVEKQLRQLCEENGMMFQSYVDLIQVIRATINGVVGGLWVLLAIGSIIAAFGLINTLAMNILEQTREIGMLRVVAMTRSQIRKMVLAQAIIMGVIGILPGILTGIWIAYTINLSTFQVTGHDVLFRTYPQLIFGAPCFEMLIMLLAAMIPAERAARLDVSKALQYE